MREDNSTFSLEEVLWTCILAKLKALKCPCYGFLKMTFHAVCNTALSEWKHPAKFEIWKCTVYKVIVSQKKESTLNHWNESFLKWIPSRFIVTSTWKISILPAHLLVFSRWSEWKYKFSLCHQVPLLEQAVSPGTLYTKQHCTHKHQVLQAWWNQPIANRTNHRRFASCKGGFGKNVLLSESFGSRWGNKIDKIKCIL